jgi:hypothetical protein
MGSMLVIMTTLNTETRIRLKLTVKTKVQLLVNLVTGIRLKLTVNMATGIRLKLKWLRLRLTVRPVWHLRESVTGVTWVTRVTGVTGVTGATGATGARLSLTVKAVTGSWLLLLLFWIWIRLRLTEKMVTMVMGILRVKTGVKIIVITVKGSTKRWVCIRLRLRLEVKMVVLWLTVTIKVTLMGSIFFLIPCCLSFWYFRLEESMHRTPPAWGLWLAYVPLCWLRAWEPMERLTRPQPKHFTVKPYYGDQYW